MLADNCDKIQDEIKSYLKDNNKITKHSIKVKFNDPSEDHFIDVIAHFLGPYTEKI